MKLGFTHIQTEPMPNTAVLPYIVELKFVFLDIFNAFSWKNFVLNAKHHQEP